ncbi:MAG TPA: type II toxin-antitoxin system ParD family antitoxin [Tepidisphaeraceae bacterium]|nr:type II toxin-antitoxin system ParD family antitoxin [Tepidisphaeraceae bacterium]
MTQTRFRTLAGFVEGRVMSGRYHTASEVVREALRILEERESQREAAFAALKAKLQRASGL